MEESIIEIFERPDGKVMEVKHTVREAKERRSTHRRSREKTTSSTPTQRRRRVPRARLRTHLRPRLALRL
jgi:hypothetical protein